MEYTSKNPSVGDTHRALMATLDKKPAISTQSSENGIVTDRQHRVLYSLEVLRVASGVINVKSGELIIDRTPLSVRVCFPGEFLLGSGQLQ